MTFKNDAELVDEANIDPTSVPELNNGFHEPSLVDNGYQKLHNGEEVPKFDLKSTHWTLRSLVVGCLLGTIISASNFYLGLKM